MVCILSPIPLQGPGKNLRKKYRKMVQWESGATHGTQSQTTSPAIHPYCSLETKLEDLMPIFVYSREQQNKNCMSSSQKVSH